MLALGKIFYRPALRALTPIFSKNGPFFGNLFFNFLGICSFHDFRKRKYVESGFSVFFAGMIGREIVIPL